jgi:hypothetical protein
VDNVITREGFKITDQLAAKTVMQERLQAPAAFVQLMVRIGGGCGQVHFLSGPVIADR